MLSTPDMQKRFDELKAKDFNRQKGEADRLRMLVAKLGPADIHLLRVEVGTVTTPNPPMDAKFLHMYEVALQVNERPQAYLGHVRAFEGEQEFWPDR